jgi:hypothetical protein
MARVKYGGIVTDLSGSVAGSTFQKSQFGSIMRTKPNPSFRSSRTQVNIRYQLTQVHASWRSLSSAQRSTWDQFPSYSNPTIKRDRGILLSGHALFVKYNMLRLLVGLSILEDPVFISMPQVPIPDGNIGRDVAAMGWALDDTYDDDALFFVLKLSNPQVESRRYRPASIRFMNVVQDGGSAIDLVTAYPDIFGTIPPAGVFLSYSLQWLGKTSPVYNAAQTGTIEVISY